MAQRDSIHDAVKQALVKDGWDITDDPYVIAFGERFLFVDLGAEDNQEIVGNLSVLPVLICELRSRSKNYGGSQ